MSYAKPTLKKIIQIKANQKNFKLIIKIYDKEY